MTAIYSPKNVADLQTYKFVFRLSKSFIYQLMYNRVALKEY